jgi:hypothetical protein
MALPGIRDKSSTSRAISVRRRALHPTFIRSCSMTPTKAAFLHSSIPDKVLSVWQFEQRMFAPIVAATKVRIGARSRRRSARGHYEGWFPLRRSNSASTSRILAWLNLNVPASRKSFRQRVGRIGRQKPGAFAVIAEPYAFRRFGMSLADYHASSVEPSYLYLQNRFIQYAHARCLADELEMLGVNGRKAAPGFIGRYYI